MKYKLAVSPINWRNDDLPDIGASNTMEKFLTEASQIGYDGVEMGAQYPREADKLQALLGSYKLDLASGWFDIGLLNKTAEEQMKEITPHLELLRAMGCKLVIVCETQGTSVHGNMDTPANNRHILSNDEWTRFTKRLDDLAAMMKASGMPMSYHPHIGTVIESESDIDRMMAECPNLGLLYDAGHLAYAGADPLSMWNKYLSRINHIHLKDVRRSIIEDVRTNNKSFLQGVVAGTFTVPSDGDLDFDSILNAVQASAYQGWLVVEAEQNPDVAPADIYAKKALDYLTNKLA